MKSRIIYLIFSTFCTFFILYYYKIEIVYLIGKPFVELQQTFIFLDLTEAFYTLLKISAILTFLLLIPYFMYHLWGFFIPSSYQLERNNLNFFFFLFFCLWTSEFLFTYLVFLTKICSFLISFEMGIPKHLNSDLVNMNCQPLIKVEFTARIESYVKLIVKISSFIFLCSSIRLLCLHHTHTHMYVFTYVKRYLLYENLNLNMFICMYIAYMHMLFL